MAGHGGVPECGRSRWRRARSPWSVSSRGSGGGGAARGGAVGARGLRRERVQRAGGGALDVSLDLGAATVEVLRGCTSPWGRRCRRSSWGSSAGRDLRIERLGVTLGPLAAHARGEVRSAERFDLSFDTGGPHRPAASAAPGGAGRGAGGGDAPRPAPRVGGAPHRGRRAHRPRTRRAPRRGRAHGGPHARGRRRRLARRHDHRPRVGGEPPRRRHARARHRPRAHRQARRGRRSCSRRAATAAANATRFPHGRRRDVPRRPRRGEGSWDAASRRADVTASVCEPTSRGCSRRSPPRRRVCRALVNASMRFAAAFQGDVDDVATAHLRLDGIDLRSDLGRLHGHLDAVGLDSPAARPLRVLGRRPRPELPRALDAGGGAGRPRVGARRRRGGRDPPPTRSGRRR